MVHGHGGSWVGATMAPEGKDNVKGQACLVCKRNSLLPLTLIGRRIDESVEQGRQFVRSSDADG